jgi:hypothetical protein
MVYSGQTGQLNYQQYMPQGVPGTMRGMGSYRVEPYLNNATGRRAVVTITPPSTPDANQLYSLLIDGIFGVNVTTDSSPTAVELGQLIYDAIRANPQLFRYLDPSLNTSSGVVTITQNYFNTALTIVQSNAASTTNDLTIQATTAPGTGAMIPYGRFVGRKSTFTMDSNGVSAAALIDDATANVWTVLGPTLKDFYEKDRKGPDALVGYPFGRTMSVLEDTGTYQGVLVEVVESDIKAGDPLYIAVAAGNEGKASKTSSSNIDVSARGRFVSDAFTALGLRLAYVYWKRF